MKELNIFLICVSFICNFDVFEQVEPDTLWVRTFGGSQSDQAITIIETTDSYYIVVGSTYSYGNGLSDGWVIKIDNQGNEIFNKTFGGSFL